MIRHLNNVVFQILFVQNNENHDHVLMPATDWKDDICATHQCSTHHQVVKSYNYSGNRTLAAEITRGFSQILWECCKGHVLFNWFNCNYNGNRKLMLLMSFQRFSSHALDILQD